MRVRSATRYLPATGQRQRGRVAGGLSRALARDALAVAVACAAAFLSFWATGKTLLGLVAALATYLTLTQLQKRRHIRLRSGRHGERLAAGALARVPDCDVFHDYPIGKENCDHIVVTEQGVFTVEVKHHRSIQVSRDGIYKGGCAQPQFLTQATRQASKIHRLTRCAVTPIIVFTHPQTQFAAETVSGVHCVTLPNLPTLITRLRRERSGRYAPMRREAVEALERAVQRTGRAV